MITIVFPDRETEKRALVFLLGHFSGRVLKTGEHLVPEAALEALADQNIPFTVIGKQPQRREMSFDWAAGLADENPTSVELQHLANEWRTGEAID